MTGILDASAAAELALGGEKKEELARVIRLYTWIAAPSLYVYEFTELVNAYSKWLALKPETAARVIASAAGLVDEFFEDKRLAHDAIVFSGEYGVPLAACFYLAAAKAGTGVLISIDPVLRRAARDAGIGTAESLG